jgi:hypothetical protein
MIPIMNPIINEFGTKKWFNSKGQLHRDDGPAIIFDSGAKVWFINGKFHRTDGPAFENSYGEKGWYLNNIQIFCNNNDEFLRIVKMKELL